MLRSAYAICKSHCHDYRGRVMFMWMSVGMRARLCVLFNCHCTRFYMKAWWDSLLCAENILIIFFPCLALLFVPPPPPSLSLHLCRNRCKKPSKWVTWFSTFLKLSPPIKLHNFKCGLVIMQILQVGLPLHILFLIECKNNTNPSSY